MDLSDFFLYLWDTKHLSLPSIRGYRSALGPVLRQAGLDISHNEDLSALFRAFANSAPPRSPRIPSWDLSLVLRSLMRAPYEPIRLASLRDVTLKTAFLLALASARRVSELHGLSAGVRHSKGWSSVTLSLAPDFLAKTQLPCDESLSEFTIPTLAEFVGDSEGDRLLCPVQAIRNIFIGPGIAVHDVPDFLLLFLNLGGLCILILFLSGYVRLSSAHMGVSLRRTCAWFGSGHMKSGQ